MIDGVRARRPLILGYHGIGEMDPRGDPIGLYVRPQALREQIRSLKRRHYEFVTMDEFADRVRSLGGPPRGVCALTFDDGTLDQATVLPGLLEEMDVPATIYVCPGLSGTAYPWADPSAGIRFMSESELVGLSGHPLVEIGAHTNEHRELHEADRATALEEMVACRQTLEELLSTEVTSFCYPRCHYSEDARAAAPLAGYKSAVTCGLRGSWDLYELKRETFHLLDGPTVVALRSRGLYAGLGGSRPALAARFLVRTGDRARGLLSGFGS
jgi:peptidoglycan/xylan/chitin deacetylase (PgdA/CDA1 family)